MQSETIACLFAWLTLSYFLFRWWGGRGIPPYLVFRVEKVGSSPSSQTETLFRTLWPMFPEF